MTEVQLSGLDWQILQLLREDGRMSVSRLAERLNRSRTTIAQHLARLQDTGVITGFSVLVDEEKLGFGLSAYVRLQAASSKHRKITDTLLAMPEVAECHILTGANLLMLRVVARDMAHLRALVESMTRHGATQTEVIFVTHRGQAQIDNALREAAR